MTALFVVELRRALARRLVRLLLLAAVVGIVVVGVWVFLTAETRDPAQAARASIIDHCGALFDDPARCEAEAPSVSELAENVSLLDDPRFALTDLWPVEGSLDSEGGEGDDDNVLATTSVLFFAFALVAGASFVGAESRAGTIETLLTWEPRRTRVMLVKLAAAAVVAFFAYLVLQVMLGLALVPTAVFRGTTEGADAEFYRHLGEVLVRAGALTAGLAVAGGCLAALARNTAGALSVFFAYLVGVELVLQSLRENWTEWFFLPNFLIVFTEGELEIPNFSRSVSGAAILLVLYLAGLVTVTVVTFRARDLG